jgi:hypothetical protein
MRLCPPLLVLGLSAALGGCQEIALVGLIENNNYRTTGRSISGWAISAASDEDCEPMRAFERQPVCREKPPPPPVDPVCYRTLAAVTCYDRADPKMPQSRLLPAPGQSR